MTDSQKIGALYGILRDPNIRFPNRPKLIDDLLIFEIPQGLGITFRGGPNSVTLQGREVEKLWTFLKTELTGVATLDDILEHSRGLGRELDVLSALHLLHSKGLLIDEDPYVSSSISGDGVLSRQKLFWGRKLGITRYHSSAENVQRALATARILLVGTGLFGAIVYDLLVRAGVSSCAVFAWQDDGIIQETMHAAADSAQNHTDSHTASIDLLCQWLSAQVEICDLIVVATRNGPAQLFHTINRICLDHRKPWLKANEDGEHADLGPLILPFESSCYACLDIQERRAQTMPIEEQLFQEHLLKRDVQDGTPKGESLAAATLCASLIIMEIERFITGIVPCTAIDAVIQIDLVRGYSRTDRLLRLPLCPECSGGIEPDIDVFN